MKIFVRNRPVASALLRIAARVEHLDIFRTLASSPTPFADLILYPEKLEDVLKMFKDRKQRAILAPEKAAWLQRSELATTKRRRACRESANPLKGLKNTEFILEAPAARSVKLAADFTDWEKSPLDLTRSEEGVWFIIVPLLPDSYVYRFIVDGQWCDDPRPVQRIANPYGTTDAVVNVT